MKIIISKKEVPFSKIPYGDLFAYGINDELVVKMRPQHLKDSGAVGCVNAVSIRHGGVSLFLNNDMVRPVTRIEVEFE